jgi:hypothetical protein
MYTMLRYFSTESMGSIITAYNVNKHLGILTPRLERRYLRVLAAIENLPITRIQVTCIVKPNFYFLFISYLPDLNYFTPLLYYTTSSTPSTNSSNSSNSSNSENSSNSSNSSSSSNSSNSFPPKARVKEFENLDQTKNRSEKLRRKP